MCFPVSVKTAIAPFFLNLIAPPDSPPALPVLSENLKLFFLFDQLPLGSRAQSTSPLPLLSWSSMSSLVGSMPPEGMLMPMVSGAGLPFLPTLKRKALIVIEAGDQQQSASSASVAPSPCAPGRIPHRTASAE